MVIYTIIILIILAATAFIVKFQMPDEIDIQIANAMQYEKNQKRLEEILKGGKK